MKMRSPGTTESTDLPISRTLPTLPYPGELGRGAQDSIPAQIESSVPALTMLVLVSIRISSSEETAGVSASVQITVSVS